MFSNFKNRWQQNPIKFKAQRMNLINQDKSKSNRIKMKFRDYFERNNNCKMKLKVFENGESIKTKKSSNSRIKCMS